MSMPLFFLILLMVPQDNEILFEKANKAYTETRYDEALSHYETLLERGVSGGKLHFNIGNAYFQNDQLGRAILHYCKASRYLPGDADIQTNLAFVDSRREDPVIEGEDEAFAQTFDRLVRGVSYSMMFQTALVLLCIGGLTSLILVARPHSRKWLGYVLVIACTLGILLAGASFFQYKQLTRADMAVMVAPQADVYAGPSLSLAVSFTLHEGIRCWILDEAEGWLRIGLANGYNGWVPRAAIERI